MWPDEEIDVPKTIQNGVILREQWDYSKSIFIPICLKFLEFKQENSFKELPFILNPTENYIDASWLQFFINGILTHLSDKNS